MNAESRQETWALAIASAERKFTEIAIADGNLVTYQREAMFALQCVGGSEHLQKCDTESLRNAVINVASVGLTINPAMKLAYLVPRKGKACLDISYIGLVKIATDSGGVLAVAAIPVRANDRFIYRGPFEAPEHIFNPFASETERGEIIGVYTIAKLTSGVTQIETLSRGELDKIRAMSKAASGPWFDWFEEMVKKSVIKRASKLWPRTERLAAAEAILNEHQGNETIIDGTTGEIIEQPQSRSKPAAEQKKPDPPTAEQKRPEAQPADDKPITPGAIKTIRAQMERASLSTTDLHARFGKDADGKLIEGWTIDRLGMSEANAVLEWVKNPQG